MRPVRVIGPEFKLLGEIDTYTSLQWTRRWHKPGDFELHISPQMQGADALQEGNMIFKATNTSEAAIIGYRHLENVEGKDTLKIKGYHLGSLLGRRITVPPAGVAYDKANAQTESIMHQFVMNNCISPIDAARVIPHLVAAPDLSRGGKMFYQTRYKPLAEELEALSVISGLGWRVRLDLRAQQYVFEVLEGRNLSASQHTLPPAVFSHEFDNVRSQSLLQSSMGYKNMAYAAGQGEGEERLIVEVFNEHAGLDRYELFVDARDIGTQAPEEEPYTLEELQEMVWDRGMQRLSEHPLIQEFSTEILTTNNLVYREDWDLGDIVTVRNRDWGITLDARVVEVKEIIEQQGEQIQVTFGNKHPTLVDMVKRELRA